MLHLGLPQEPPYLLKFMYINPQYKPFKDKLLLVAIRIYLPFGHCMAISVGITVIDLGGSTVSTALKRSKPAESSLATPIYSTRVSTLKNVKTKLLFLYLILKIIVLTLFEHI